MFQSINELIVMLKDLWFIGESNDTLCEYTVVFEMHDLHS
jgi:hypothetical protein